MKKNTLAALILTTLAVGQLTSLQAHAAGSSTSGKTLRNPRVLKPRLAILKSSTT